MKSIITHIIVLFVGIVIGGELSHRKVETVIEKEYLPPTTILADNIFPYSVSTWEVNDVDVSIPKYIVDNDTVYVDRLITKTDSLDIDDLRKIADDYVLLRKYKLDYSTDTTGKFEVDLSVSNNKLLYSSATISPIRSSVVHTVYTKPKLFTPFFIAGSSVDFSTQNIMLGVSIRQKFMVGASWVRLNNYSGYTINFGFNL